MKFNYIVLATNVDKREDCFSGEGDWMLLKCFVENENGYGEFYINLNTKTGEGEIVPKDLDYGNFLLSVLKQTLKAN